LIVDLPPGTGDEPLTVAQSLPSVDGVIIVTTPQDVALVSVRKSIRFAQMLGLKVIGLVDNMNGYVCPRCGQESCVFGGDLAETTARQYGIPYLGRIPLRAEVASSGEAGTPFILNHDPSAEAFWGVVEKVVSATN